MKYVVVGPKDIYGPFLIEKEANRFRDIMTHGLGSTDFQVRPVAHPMKGHHRAAAERKRHESWIAGGPAEDRNQ